MHHIYRVGSSTTAGELPLAGFFQDGNFYECAGPGVDNNHEQFHVRLFYAIFGFNGLSLEEELGNSGTPWLGNALFP